MYFVVAYIANEVVLWGITEDEEDITKEGTGII